MARLLKGSTVGGVKIMSESGGELQDYTEGVVETTGIINLTQGNIFVDTPTANRTYSITNAKNGVAHSFTLQINMNTVRTLIFPASIKWQGGKIPDLTKSNKTYLLSFMTADGGTTWLGMFGGEF